MFSKIQLDMSVREFYQKVWKHNYTVTKGGTTENVMADRIEW